MRKLDTAKRELILSALIEGCGVRATARLCKVSKLTVSRLLCDIGLVCDRFHRKHVRELNTTRVEVDEIWSFCGCKRASVKLGKRGHGDVWVWAGLDSDTRLIIAYHVGARTTSNGARFVRDIARRVKNRVQLSSDALKSYEPAVKLAFGDRVDWARVMKIFSVGVNSEDRRYSPPKFVGCTREAVIGAPNLLTASTSYIERQNLNARLFTRRLTRLTNGYSRKVENHAHAIALHYWAHNWIRKCATLKQTPAQAAGLTNRQWTVADLVRLLEHAEDQSCYGPAGSRINRADRA